MIASATLQPRAIPLLADAASLPRDGFVTGASLRNWASCGEYVVLPASCPDWQRNLLSDPQTSGGLPVACAPESAAAIVRTIGAAGHPAAGIIGHAEAGKPVVNVV